MSKMKSPKHRQVRTGLKGSHRRRGGCRRAAGAAAVLVAWVAAVAVLTVYC